MDMLAIVKAAKETLPEYKHLADIGVGTHGNKDRVVFAELSTTSSDGAGLYIYVMETEEARGLLQCKIVLQGKSKPADKILVAFDHLVTNSLQDASLFAQELRKNLIKNDLLVPAIQPL